MPVLTITAVDHTQDLFTCAGHGLNTGDGPAVIRNITAGGALPTGAAAVTDYWAIRVDANTFKLASSNANALSNTPINLTANGSGTNILEIGIPYTRARTYVARAVNVAGSQLKSVDLNSLMDSWKSLHRFLTGQAQSIWTDLVLAANQHVVVSGSGKYKRPQWTTPYHASAAIKGSGGGASGSFTDQLWTFASTGETLLFNIPCEAGQRIHAVSAIVFDVGASNQARMSVKKNAISVGGGQTQTQLGSNQDSSGSGFNAELLTVSGLTEDVPSDGLTSYVCKVEALSCSGAGFNLGVAGFLVTKSVP